MPAPSLPLTGGCGCGAVRFEITPAARAGGVLPLHALPAPHRGGRGRLGAGRAGLVRDHGGRGADLKAWSPGDGFDKVFCGECGSAVLVRDPASGEVAMVRLGEIDGDPGVRPAAHQFVAYAAAWEPLPDDGLPRYDERMPAPG